MKNAALILSGMQERKFRELLDCYSKGDILGVCRIVYKHLQSDRRRNGNKQVRIEQANLGSGYIPKDKMEFKTIGDLEKLWK